MKMTTGITAIILFKDNQQIIGDCLQSINWVEEIIAVDLGSKDKTIDKVRKFVKSMKGREIKLKIVKAEGKDDFSAWRNQGAKYASKEWLFYIDADERCSNYLKQELEKATRLEASAYKLKRRNFFLGKEFKSAGPDYVIRLIRKKDLLGWVGNLHEYPKINGQVLTLKEPLIHLTHTSLKQMLTKTIWWSQLEADNRFKSGHPKMNSWRFWRIFLTGLYDSFIKKGYWKEGAEGVIEGIYQAFSLFITYVRLWERQRQDHSCAENESYSSVERGNR